MFFTSYLFSFVSTESAPVFIALGSVKNSFFKDGSGIMTRRDLLQEETPILEETRENFVFPLVIVEGVGEPPLNPRRLAVMGVDGVQVILSTSQKSKDSQRHSLSSHNSHLAGLPPDDIVDLTHSSSKKVGKKKKRRKVSLLILFMMNLQRLQRSLLLLTRSTLTFFLLSERRLSLARS